MPSVMTLSIFMQQVCINVDKSKNHSSSPSSSTCFLRPRLAFGTGTATWQMVSRPWAMARDRSALHFSRTRSGQMRKGIGARKVLPGFAAGSLFSQLSRGNIHVSRSGGEAFTAPPTPFRIGSSYSPLLGPTIPCRGISYTCEHVQTPKAAHGNFVLGTPAFLGAAR